MLFGESVESPIFFLRLLPAIALDRRPAWRRVPPLYHLSSPYTLNTHKGRCMSHVNSVHSPGDPRQTAVTDVPKLTLSLVASRFEHRTWVVCAKQPNHSNIAANIKWIITKFVVTKANKIFCKTELWRLHFTTNILTYLKTETNLLRILSTYPHPKH